MQTMKLSSPVFRTLDAEIALTGWLLFIPALTAADVSLDQFMLKRGYEGVPMKHGYKNRFYAEAKLNGKPLRALVDTGASDLILDERRAASLKRQAAPVRPTYTPFGKLASELPVVDLERLELAGVVFTNCAAVVFDLHKDREVRTGSYIPTK